MGDSDFTIPEDQLPDGFAESVDDPPAQPVPARPAATVVLMRDTDHGLEVLLLRRVRSSGFVPGAWVFPGGRVDAGDGSQKVLERTLGLTVEAAAARLDLQDARTPAAAYYVAAFREAFEETGILVGRSERGERTATAHAEPGVLDARERLLAGTCSFADALEKLGAFLDSTAMEYIAHWITPTVEPRRYDTRFFAAAVDESAVPAIHEKEMTAALWIAPSEALARSEARSLAMVFPTLKTLEALSGFDSTAAVLQDFRSRTIPSILPRLIRTSEGITLRIPEVVSERG